MPTTIDVRFYELDPYGHVNHGIYLNYFEVGRIERLESVGLGLGRLRELGFHLVVVEAHVRFRSPAVESDQLVVHSRVAEVRRASARWVQTIHRGEQLIATNELRSAVTDLEGRPCQPPTALMGALELLQAEDA